jgi:hypothetical protein
MARNQATDVTVQLDSDLKASGETCDLLEILLRQTAKGIEVFKNRL